MNHTRFAKTCRAVACLLMVAMLAGCAQTQTVDSWRNEGATAHKPKKVAVIVAFPDALMRQAAEMDMAEILQKKGIPAVAASTMPGLSGGIRGKIDTEKVGEILKRDGADAVLVSFYSGGGRSGDYVRSGYWARYEGTGVGYGWAEPYFVDVYSVQHGEDPVDFQIQVWIETTYVDLESEVAIWRIVTETKDIEHTDTARNIANRSAAEIAALGLK